MQPTTQADYTIVESPEDLRRASETLAGSRKLAVDTEVDTLYHYGETVCLVQVFDGVRAYLVDTLKVKDLSPLAPVIADTSVEKILHGSDFDIRLLRRHFGIECRPVFDTEIAVRFLGRSRSGLAATLQERFGVILDKKHQKTDWTRRPLRPAMCSYAAADVRWLIPLACLLKKDLRELGRLDWVEEECGFLAASPDRETNDGPLFVRFKGAGKMARRELGVLEKILQFRETLARKRNLPPFKVLGNETILQILRERPDTADGLQAVTGLSRRSESFLSALMGVCREGMSIPEGQLPAYPRTVRRKRLPGGSGFSRRMEALKQWRDRRAAALGLDPGLVCSARQTVALAEAAPQTAADIANIPHLRAWQKREFGSEILTVLHKKG